MRRRAQSSRRIAALVLAAGVAGSAALPPALDWRERAKGRHATVAAFLQAPLRPPRPVFAPGTAFGGTESAAGPALGSAIRDLAAREGALVERIGPRPAPAPHLVARQAVVSGSARAILRFVEAIESRAPVVRLSRYRLATNASGQSLRLDADFVMAVTAP